MALRIYLPYGTVYLKTGRGRTAIAFNLGHGAGVAISANGRVKCVLELERLFEVRYWGQLAKVSKGLADCLGCSA